MKTNETLKYLGAAALAAASAYLASDKVKTAVDAQAKKASKAAKGAYENVKDKFK